MPPKKPTTKATTKTPIAATKHKDKRKNIPTEELANFMTEEQKQEKPLLYPRDPSLDPQLVWKGKDELDRKDLEVPSVPVYIQEKIHPQAIVEDLRAYSDAGKPEDLQLFSDFNGIKFEEMIDFYHHEQNWSNRMILGDSLLVMTSLAEREALKGKVQMIYIDPPYGIKFGSNWQVSTRKRDVKDGSVEDATRQPEQVKAFRDTWELGIHSYLTYLRDRLVAARELLTESGSVFVQIGDENVHLVRCLMDEVFGSENIVATVAFKKTGSSTSESLSVVFDYVLWYAKSKGKLKYRALLVDRTANLEALSLYRYRLLENGSVQTLSNLEASDTRGADGKPCQSVSLTSQHPSNTRSLPYSFRNEKFNPPRGRQWSISYEGLDRLKISSRLFKAGDNLRFAYLLDDNPFVQQTNVWTDLGTGSFTEDQTYVVQTSVKVIQRCMLMATDPGDLVLDPTCGSGTTAYVAEQWGRRWITIDTSRVALALARTRLMAGRFPYYHLADSPEGIKQETELTGIVPPPFKTTGDIRKGFVYKRVPHITLKSIANNSEIDVIYEKWQAKLEPLREKLNKQLKQKWEEWEIPREADSKWDAATKDAHKTWWEYRRLRQKEIDESIAKRADTELLYDQPYEDKKRMRVTGPFTVESLSPHRRLSVEQKKKDAEQWKDGRNLRVHGADQFAQMILENLRKAGVQNTYKNERLKFDRLEIFPGEWLQGEGEYTDTSSKQKRVAVCIGPEYGTVSPDLIKEAAKEAMRGAGFDMLLVCGFAFDPLINEEVKQYGRLMVLPVRMNSDLSMGNELLKKTGTGNLFMIFGEPDIKISTLKDGQLQVEIKGLDVYDPTTGQIRSSKTDDIACWFIDTNYNGESFFVRHAYFTGEGDPYKKLKTVLKAEIDEDAWSTLYSTVSRPFDPPAKGRIAIKVINHYGDEVVQVYEVGKK